MKKMFLLALCAAVLPVLAAAQETAVIEKYADKTINGVIVAGAFDVQLAQADGASRTVGAKVEIEKELADKLVFELTDEGYVRLTFKNDMGKYFTRSKKKPQAWVTVSDLKYLNVTGASHVVCTGVCSAKGDLRILTSGSASVNLLEVSAQTLHVDLSGTSALNDAKLTVQEKAEVVLSGTSKAGGELKAGTAVCTVSGLAGLTLSGSAGEAVLDVSGTSSADLENFNIGTVNAKVSGMGKVKAHVIGGGTAEVSTMGSFRYKGAGLVTGKGVKQLD
ncbi:DUF2807 domain-containing protein [uncultured Rikenella sp.]|uniref:GIN domain-containing protein n=1 Tax=uncultured Rikenella sp. TaxID=368003 RepID=UPI00262210B4|nr:DUF2807 domain-containing protein [uncultured Rikenella sp.]